MAKAAPLIAVGATLNLGVGYLVTILKLPLYLDSIGTVFVAIVSGPWTGIAAGIVAALVAGVFFNPSLPYYIPVVCAIGGLAGFLARRGFFTSWPRVILGGLLQGVAALIVSTPITAYVFGGVTPAGSTSLIALLQASGETLSRSVFLTQLTIEPIDKTLTYVIALLLARNLPGKLLERYSGATHLRRRADRA
jgi:energy-coupling factor transport system substrate-specific component